MNRPPDSLPCLFSGNFYKPSAPSCVYVARLKNFRGIHKVGMCQLPFRDWRWGDEEYGTICKQIKATRLECWLVEQRVLHKTKHAWACPKALQDKKWPGYTELRSLSATGPLKLQRMAQGILINLQAKGIHAFVDEYLPSAPKWQALRQQWLEAA